LHGHEARIHAPLHEARVMGTLLDDSALVRHHDQIGVAHAAAAAPERPAARQSAV
jgi:hypothetical protein